MEVQEWSNQTSLSLIKWQMCYKPLHSTIIKLNNISRNMDYESSLFSLEYLYWGDTRTFYSCLIGMSFIIEYRM